MASKEDKGKELKLSPEEWEKLMLPPKLRRGQMPKPEFLDVPNPFPGKTGKPIGIMAFSFIGSENGDIKLKPFIWCENIGGDLTNETFREDIVNALTVLKMSHEGMDLAVGPAISLRKSIKERRVVKIYHPGTTIGIYVNSATEWWRSDLKGRINNLFSDTSVAEGGLLEAKNQDRFGEIRGLVKMLLPRPVGNSPKR